MMLLPLLLVAQAEAVEFRWWGIGPMVGTRIVPLKYPIFPGFVEGADGEPTVARAEGNLIAGLHAGLYVSNIGRLGLRGHLDTNFDHWFGQEATLEWDHLLVRDGELQLMLGAGLGIGHERFTTSDTVYLDNTYFPVRAQLSGLLRDKWRAYEIDLFGTWHIIGAAEYCDGISCDEGSKKGDDFFDQFGLYLGVGLETTVFFGNFRSAKVD